MTIDEMESDSRVDARPGQRVGGTSHGKRRLAVWVLLLAAAAGALAWVVFHPHGASQQAGHGHPGAGGPTPVVAAPVHKGNIDITFTGLGTVTPLATVTVKTEIAGYLLNVGFQEGQMVREGDFLAQIDPRPYQRQLEQYQGQLLHDQALLKNAQLDLKRYRTLVAQDSIATQQADTQEALVQQYQGTVATDQALIDTAKLNLTYCHITAPVTGRVGLRQVDPGNYVQTSDANGIVVITQLQPISVIFVLPEDDLPRVLKRLHGGAELPVVAFDRAGTTKLATGKLGFMDNQIDTSTGTVKLRAVFDNRDGMLFPNQFVNAELMVDTLHDSLVMPTAAIQRGAPGTFVYLVKADDTVTVRPVKLGPISGSEVAVLSGLEDGEKVVVDGADKLREGAKVTLPAAKDQVPAPEDGGHHRTKEK